MLPQSDRQLTYRISAHNDHNAFQELHSRYGRKVYQLIAFRIGQKEDAEDLTAQVFLEVWRYLTGQPGKEIDNFRAFLYKMARNALASFYRAEEKTPEFIELDRPGEYGDYPDLTDEQEDLFQKQLRAQDEDFLIECVQKLKEPYREVVALRFFEELRIKEIAEIIEKSPGNIRIIIHRAIKMLENIMRNNQKV